MVWNGCYDKIFYLKPNQEEAFIKLNTTFNLTRPLGKYQFTGDDETGSACTYTITVLSKYRLTISATV